MYYFVAQEEQNLQGVAVEATTRLKQTVINERETKLRLQAELELLQVIVILLHIFKISKRKLYS